MPEREALDRAVYDHEIEDPASRGERRRRRVDDWGVGEELFDRMPSQRLSRADAHPRPRRASGHASPPTSSQSRRFDPASPPTSSESRRFEPTPPPTSSQSRRFDPASPPTSSQSRRFDPASPPTWSESRRFEPTPPARPGAAALDASSPAARSGAPRPDASSPRPDRPAARAEVSAPQPGERPRADVAGRRTVVIGGRPGPLGQLPARRRPPRTTTERIGARPDRIVAWAVALGLLLILIAVATAHAAVATALTAPLVIPTAARRLPHAAGDEPAERDRRRCRRRSSSRV